MINKGMMSSKSDLYETPQWLFDKLNKIFHFDLDVCALPQNTKCDKYFTPEDNGLLQEWSGTCWMNPPYGRQIGKWIKKAYDVSIGGVLLFAYFPRELIRSGSMSIV